MGSNHKETNLLYQRDARVSGWVHDPFGHWFTIPVGAFQSLYHKLLYR